jgi:hypothetical protein
VDASAAFDGAALVYSVEGPAGITIDPATGIVSIPTADPVEAAEVTVTAANSGGAAEAGFTLTVEAAAIAPVLSTLAVDAEVVPPVVSFQTDQDGLAYWMVDATPTATAAAVKAGAGEASGQLAVDQGIVTEDVDLAGVTKGAARYFHIMLENPNGQSNVLSLAFEVPEEVRSGVVAIGGTVMDYTDADGDWRAHVFTETATLDVTSGGEVEYLIVGGGGGGGQRIGGGGGAGGFRTGTASIDSGAFEIIVGRGGAGAPAGSTSRGASGGASSALGLTANGGGGGGTNSTVTMARGGDGGSGGGGVFPSSNAGYAGGSGVSGQGNAGGSTVAGEGSGSNGTSSGGGGAGAAGVNGSNTGTPTQGSGGAGLASSITGTSVNYAGGGGGAGYGSGRAGSGGLGGGGGGSRTGNGNSGQAGTGGGGGGGTLVGSTNYAGGDGGSGVVILRYKR